MIRALVFDLDDTLYPEREFVASGYQAVAQFLSDNYGLPLGEVFHVMITTFATQGRHRVLPLVQEQFLRSRLSLATLVEVYREHTPTIHLVAGYKELLSSFRKSYRLGIITDGTPEVQRRKVKALGLEGAVDRIIYTWDYGREKQKPHPFCFSLMLEVLSIEASKTLFIGDSAAKDCGGAHAAGMKCVQVQGMGASGCALPPDDRADYSVESLFQLQQILSSLQN